MATETITATITAGSETITHEVVIAARGPASSGGTTLTSYASQVATLPDYPTTFPNDDVTAATSAATPSKIAKRDAQGGIAFTGITLTDATLTSDGTGGFTLASTGSGTITINSGTGTTISGGDLTISSSMIFSTTSYTFGSGAGIALWNAMVTSGTQAACLAGLGGGSTAGIPIFQATSYSGVGSVRKLAGIDVDDGPTFATLTIGASATKSGMSANGSGTLLVNSTNSAGIQVYGPLVVRAALQTVQQAISGNGAVAAVNTTTTTTTIANTGTANTTTTLAAGIDGNIKIICFITDGGFDAVVTVTNPGWGGVGTITFNDAGNSVMMQYLGSKWQIISNNGATLA